MTWENVIWFYSGGLPAAIIYHYTTFKNFRQAVATGKHKEVAERLPAAVNHLILIVGAAVSAALWPLNLVILILKLFKNKEKP